MVSLYPSSISRLSAFSISVRNRSCNSAREPYAPQSLANSSSKAGSVLILTACHRHFERDGFSGHACIGMAWRIGLRNFDRVAFGPAEDVLIDLETQHRGLRADLVEMAGLLAALQRLAVEEAFEGQDHEIALGGFVAGRGRLEPCMLLAEDVHALCQLFFGHRARIGLQ